MAASSLMLFIQKQCSTFTGMIPVFGDFLILFEWYWATAGTAPEKLKEVAGFTSAHTLQECTERVSCHEISRAAISRSMKVRLVA
eukprot:scaffold114539_cov38-Phaeocystis_antarctica.AAC.1